MTLKKVPVLILLSLCMLMGSLFPSCSQKKVVETKASQFVVRDFNPVSNWHYDTAGEESKQEFMNRSINLDYTNAIHTGFIIPTVQQVPEGKFVFTFSVKNTGDKPRKFHYKIFYQNESYKFSERDALDTTKESIYSAENFYGSWENTGKSFAETGLIPADNEFHKVTDAFRIVGNPRNEQRYFSKWGNDRWKRNPRVGKYSFMLIVTTEENLTPNGIPPYIRDISLPSNNTFVNPYYYFLYGEGRKINNCIAQQSPYYLKVTAKPDLGAGIWIPPNFFTKETAGKYFCKTCGQDTGLNNHAAIQQFMNYIDPSTRMNNIPVIADVLKDNYSRTDYNWNRSFYTKEELVGITATTAKTPCTTLKSDPQDHTITMWNPASEYGNWQKQNVGIETRHGFTYGKWTVKAKLTELLNKNSLWNGLTNAIWLITQEQSDWNIRRSCNKEGYLANYYGGDEDKRVPNVSYSEIDFEILKTVPYCPSYLLPPAYNNPVDDQYDLAKWNVPFPEEIINDDGNVSVACTNWDMACWEPENFSDGCRTLSYMDKTFWMHRWSKKYRALTEKTPEPDDELFGSPYFYFQIDWEPTEIIWRIGPSKDKLRVVGYMNDKVTSIPNNQMLLIITQEFHNTKWWIGSPYSQDNIPFPKSDILGEIFEITIE